MYILAESMSWSQINEALKPMGYYVSNLTNVIMKDGRIVAKMKNKRQAINFIQDRVRLG